MSAVTPDSPSVQSYLSILQSVIGRMAGNSSSCKTWCITIVSAIVVVVAENERSDLVFIALLPTALFLLLDAYYLGLEREFRDAYNAFVKKLHSGEATVEDVFILAPASGLKPRVRAVGSAILSESVWPFYAFLVVTAFIARSFIGRAGA
jgi:hypothetical protein